MVQSPDDANDAFPHILQRLADLMSQCTNDQDLDTKTSPQCDEELNLLRSVQNRLERRVASVGKKRNTFAHINTLPPELLITVFAIAVDYQSDGHQCNNETLMLVCDHWNHLVNDTPSLWTQILKFDGTSLNRITRALAKSKGAPLEVRCQTLSWARDQPAQNEFLDAVFPHAHRWKKASLWLQGEAPKLRDLETLSAPLLESFCLSVDQHSVWSLERNQPLDIFGGRALPKLQELDMAGIPAPWDSKIFCNLINLTISQIQNFPPSVAQILTVLFASPNLESLTIRDVMFYVGDSMMSPNPTHMAALNRMVLCLPAQIINLILSAIHAPKCKFGELSCTIDGDPLETLFTPNISHFFERIRSRADTGSIACHSYHIGITWMGPWVINLIVDVRFIKDTINWLSAPMEPGSLAVPVELSIYGTESPMVDDTLAAVADMELLHRVILGSTIAIASTLTLLANCTSAGGGTRWPFPELEQLRIDIILNDEEWEWEGLLRPLRARQGDPEGRCDVQRPKPLRKLEFREDWSTGDTTMIDNFRSVYWPNGLEETRRLLGPKGELIWYGRAVTLEGVLGDEPALPT